VFTTENQICLIFFIENILV